MLVSLYKKIKLFFFPFLLTFGITPLNCRHYPSCSVYAHKAIKHHGPIKGTYKAVIRIIKCQPLFSSNYL